MGSFGLFYTYFNRLVRAGQFEKLASFIWRRRCIPAVNCIHFWEEAL